MGHFNYRQGILWAENVPLPEIIKAVGTPCYLYSQTTLCERWQAFATAFAPPHKVCFAAKANSNQAVLNTFAKLGSGFDIVSGGELHRVLAAGGLSENVVFSGVGKTPEEIAFALQQKIFCFNVESQEELYLLSEMAMHHNVQAPIALRVNPDVDPLSHPYISTGLKENKFGIDIKDALQLYEKARTLPHLNIKGIAFHIGSQLTSLAPFMNAVQRIVALATRLKEQGILLSHLDIGGGLGVRYQDETPPLVSDYATALLDQIPAWLSVIVEPGRALCADAGLLITKVLYLKRSTHKHFCIVDAGMNDLIRPALYQAWHDIIPIAQRESAPIKVDVVGPICESADFLGNDRELAVSSGDLLAICQVGAYGFVTSSHYPSRPRACEVMVKDSAFKIVRKRETIEQLYEQEMRW